MRIYLILCWLGCIRLFLMPASAFAWGESAFDLPVVEINTKNSQLPIVLFLSGDGGYNAFNRQLVQHIANQGFAVVLLDSKKYFWKSKTPKTFSNDMERLMRHYVPENSTRKIHIIGYSFGASVLPYALSHWPLDLRKNMETATSISPEQHAEFEVTLASMVGSSKGNATYPFVEEYYKMRTIPMLCLFGEKEDKKTIQYFKQHMKRIQVLPGNHSFNNDFLGLSGCIVAFIKSVSHTE